MEKNQDPKCAPFCGTEHDWLKDEAHVVVDEVTLISRRPSTCFGVKIRALKQEDSAISKMGIQCTINDRQVSALSSNERVSVVEYTHGQDQLDRKVLLHGVSDLEFGVHTADEEIDASGLPHIHIIEREARVCCPGMGRGRIELDIQGGHNHDAYDHHLEQRATYVWVLEEES